MGDEYPGETISSVPRLTEAERDQLCCGTALRLLRERTSGM
jgi:hypothetical protein